MQLNKFENQLLEMLYEHYKVSGMAGIPDITDWKSKLELTYDGFSDILNHLNRLGYIKRLEKGMDSSYWAQISENGIDYLKEMEILKGKTILNNSPAIVKQENDNKYILKFRYKNDVDGILDFTKSELLQIKDSKELINSGIIYDWCTNNRKDVINIVNKSSGNRCILLPIVELINNSIL